MPDKGLFALSAVPIISQFGFFVKEKFGCGSARRKTLGRCPKPRFDAAQAAFLFLSGFRKEPKEKPGEVSILPPVPPSPTAPRGKIRFEAVLPPAGPFRGPGESEPPAVLVTFAAQK